MHIKDHSAAMKFFRTYDNVASKGKWKKFVDEMEFDSMIQEPRTMAQGGRIIGKPGGLVEPGVEYYGKTIIKNPPHSPYGEGYHIMEHYTKGQAVPAKGGRGGKTRNLYVETRKQAKAALKIKEAEGLVRKEAAKIPKATALKVKKQLKEAGKGISLFEYAPGKYEIKIGVQKGEVKKWKSVAYSGPESVEKALEIHKGFREELFPNQLSNAKFKELRLLNSELTDAKFADLLNENKYLSSKGNPWSEAMASKVKNQLKLGSLGPRTFRTVDEAKAVIKNKMGSGSLKMFKSDGDILVKATQILQGEGKYIGTFPRGATKESIMWHSFNRAASQGSKQITYDLSKIGGKLPLDENGRINWSKEINGKPAWKQVRFKDEVGKTFNWTSKGGDLKKQIDAAHGEGFFQKSMRAVDEQGKISHVFKGAVRDRLLKQELEAKLRRKLTSADDDLLKRWYETKRKGFSLTQVHHPEGVAKNVYNTQNVFTAANLKERDLQVTYRKEVKDLGEKTAKANLRKGMINLSDEMGGITAKVGSQYAGTKPTITSVAKQVKEASGLKWNQAIKTSKARTLAKTLELAGIEICGGQLAKAGGGRIGFAEQVCGMKYAEQNADASLICVATDVIVGLVPAY